MCHLLLTSGGNHYFVPGGFIAERFHRRSSINLPLPSHFHFQPHNENKNNNNNNNTHHSDYWNSININTTILKISDRFPSSSSIWCFNRGAIARAIADIVTLASRAHVAWPPVRRNLDIISFLLFHTRLCPFHYLCMVYDIGNHLIESHQRSLSHLDTETISRPNYRRRTKFVSAVMYT